MTKTRVTLWRTGISEIQQKQQLYGGGYVMGKCYQPLWRINFMASWIFRKSVESFTLWRQNFMAKWHFGELRNVATLW